MRENLTEDEFDKIKGKLEAQLTVLLQSPLRDNEEIIVPLEAFFIEALPGTHPVLENFKLLHRQIDAADALEKLKMKKLEKIRYAQRLIEGALGDPEFEAQYVFRGASGGVVAPAPGGGGSGGGGGGGP